MHNIFVSYSHKNNDWVSTDGKYALIPWLEEQLKKKDAIIWTDHALKKLPGVEYEKLISERIESADMAILLISQDFFASDFIMEKELPLVKMKYDEGKIKIIPILLSPIIDEVKESLSWLFDFQIYPDNKTPLINNISNDSSWEIAKVEILNGICYRLKNDFLVSYSDKPSSRWKSLIQKTTEVFGFIIFCAIVFSILFGAGYLHSYIKSNLPDNLYRVAYNNIDKESDSIYVYSCLKNDIIYYDNFVDTLYMFPNNSQKASQQQTSSNKFGYLAVGALVSRLFNVKFKADKRVKALVYIGGTVAIVCGYGIGYLTYEKYHPVHESKKMKEYLSDKNHWSKIISEKNMENRLKSFF